MTLLHHIGIRRRVLALIGRHYDHARRRGRPVSGEGREEPGGDARDFRRRRLPRRRRWLTAGLGRESPHERDDLSGDGSGGFIYRHGTYTALDTVEGRTTVHLAINNRDRTAGSSVRSLDPVNYVGFVRSRNGRYEAIDVAPGSSTLVLDINDEGATVGAYGDPATVVAGSFLRKANGDVATTRSRARRRLL